MALNWRCVLRASLLRLLGRRAVPTGRWEAPYVSFPTNPLFFYSGSLVGASMGGGLFGFITQRWNVKKA